MKKIFFIFCLLVLVFTLGIKWMAFRESPQPKPKKPKIHQKKEVAEPVKIIAVFERPPSESSKKTPDVKEKTKKRSEVKQSRPVKQSPDNKKIIKRSKTTANKPDKKKKSIIKVTKRHISEGLKLLKEGKPMPLLELDFEDIGIAHYLKIMKAMGGRIFVGSGSSREILGEVALYTNGSKPYFVGFKEGNLDLKDLAIEMPHEIVEEKLVDEILSAAGRKFSEDDLRCVVILPLNHQAAFMGAIKEAIKKAGFNMQDFSYFSGEYKNRSRTNLFIKNGIMRDGKKIVLNISLDISNLMT